MATIGLQALAPPNNLGDRFAWF